MAPADIQPARLQSPGAEQAHGIVGVDAVRTAAVGDDLAPPRQVPKQGGKLRQRRRARPGDVTRPVLGLGTHVEKNHLVARQPPRELLRRNLLDLVAPAQVVLGEHADLGHLPDGDVTHQCPELPDPVAREPVDDPCSLAA